MAAPSKPSEEQPFAGRKLHFVGIGGAGMSGLAQVSATLGAAVSGSDVDESAYTELLRKHGIEPRIGHSADRVPERAELVVSTAIAVENPELTVARKRGQAILHRGELLAQIAKLKPCIAVVGTHGKTTTSSMIAHCLVELDLDPAFVIGGQLRGPGSNAQWGKGDWIVVEADESDGSFLELRPTVAVLTNLELDHHAKYGSLLELERSCSEFLKFLPMEGTVVIWDRPGLARLLPTDRQAIRFDAELPLRAGERPHPTTAQSAVDLYATDVQFDRLSSQFKLLKGGEDVAAVTLGVPGAHNVLNALAALGALDVVGDLPAAAQALASFQGSARRFEAKGSYRGAEIFDDYAHHPTEVRATLEAARNLGPERLIAVFQPHLYSRTLHLARDFGRALTLADEIVVLDVYPAREEPVGEFATVSGKLVADAAADRAPGRPVWWLPTQAEALEHLKSSLGEGDVVLTIGAGDIDRVGEDLAAAA